MSSLSLTVTDLLTNLGTIFFSYRINSKRVIFETVVILLDRYHFLRCVNMVLVILIYHFKKSPTLSCDLVWQKLTWAKSNSVVDIARCFQQHATLQSVLQSVFNKYCNKICNFKQPVFSSIRHCNQFCNLPCNQLLNKYCNKSCNLKQSIVPRNNTTKKCREIKRSSHDWPEMVFINSKQFSSAAISCHCREINFNINVDNMHLWHWFSRFENTKPFIHNYMDGLHRGRDHLRSALFSLYSAGYLFNYRYRLLFRLDNILFIRINPCWHTCEAWLSRFFGNFFQRSQNQQFWKGLGTFSKNISKWSPVFWQNFPAVANKG